MLYLLEQLQLYLNDIPALTDILKHHVLGDSVMSTMLSNGMMATTLLGTDVTVSITNGNVYIDNAMVTVADIIADNGVVHIDAVLLPATNSVYDIVSNSNDHTILKTALDTCFFTSYLLVLVHSLCSHQLMQHLMLYLLERYQLY